MEPAPEDYKYFKGKSPHRTYVTKRIERKSFSDGSQQKRRGVSRVFDIPEFKEYVREKKQIVLYRTPGRRQEIKAWLDEDDVDGFTLNIQRFQIESGIPFKDESLTMGKGVLQTLFDFVQSLGYIDFSKPQGQKIDDRELKEVKKVVQEYANDPEILALLAKVDKADIVALGYRKTQLKIFENLLYDPAFFAEKKAVWNKVRDEDVWQYFFEMNQWVFGYGLNYQFNSAVSPTRLKQVVRGNDLGGGGKEVDALLKTRGFISSLALVEIKIHTTDLLKEIKYAYRRDAWQVSDELNGAIAQSHKNVEETIQNARLNPVLSIVEDDGTPTGEDVYSYQPKSYLIIGSLEEFITDNKVNRTKFSSFQLFRRNLNNPEIITFDELFERAKCIVENGEIAFARIAKESEQPTQ